MSFLSRLPVLPQFPAYKGPYSVGSFELEIPVSALPSAPSPPVSAAAVSTVQFRVFYPTAASFKPTPEPDASDLKEEEDRPSTSWAARWFGRGSPPSRPVYWVPEPHQREYLSGYVRFMGAGSGLAELISYETSQCCK